MAIFKTEPLEVKIPPDEYKLLQMVSDKISRRRESGLNKLLENNIFFILIEVDLSNTKLRRVKKDDSTINPNISIGEHDSLNEIAKERHTSVEKLIASAVPLIILKYKDVLLEYAEERPFESDFIKEELFNLEKEYGQ